MSPSPEGRKPLLDSRGMLRLEDFVRASGLDSARVEALLRSEEIEGGLFDLDDRAVGLFDDVLPSAERLRELGLVPDPGYDPEALRSVDADVEDDEDDEDQIGSGPDWVMTWGPGSSDEG